MGGVQCRLSNTTPLLHQQSIDTNTNTVPIIATNRFLKKTNDRRFFISN